jgi:NADH-quinone oxidoreductase subunit A
MLTFCLSFSIISILTIIVTFLAPQKRSLEKLTAYECGFQTFQPTTINSTDIHFYIIGVIFLIFDMEVLFLYPYLKIMYYVGLNGLLLILIFLVIIIFGFIFEYYYNVLNWVKLYLKH